MKYSNYLSLTLLLVLTISCSQIQKVTDIVSKPSAREVYARDFKENDSLLGKWTHSMTTAKTNALQVTAPFVLHGNFSSNDLSSYGYKVKLQEGEKLFVEVNQAVDSFKVFIDVFEYRNDSTLVEAPVVSSEIAKKQVSLEIDKNTLYKIVVQPEIANSSPFNIKIYTQPMFSFPVSGYKNKNIQSFWGASRDAGKRNHEGVDIFAKRGTPVVAITDGFVSYVGERGLGGKQVWQRSGLLGKSLYYAHLDSIAVKPNSRVKVGDTLGFIGNSGNARTTSPHLHFGIYTRGGAIDPLPFIKTSDIPDSRSMSVVENGQTTQRQNQLRIGPDTNYDKLATLISKQPLKIVGAADNWYHVKVGDSLEGFMHISLIKLL